jgi:PKD repeat protein
MRYLRFLLIPFLFCLVTNTVFAQTANFTAEPTSVCSGSSVTFTDESSGTTGTITYSWDFGTGASPTTAEGVGPHTVTYTGSGFSTVSLTITDDLGSDTETKVDFITVNQLPATPTITVTGDLTFCEGGSVTLTSSESDSYLWSSGETTRSIEVTESGDYTVTVTDANLCTSSPSAVTTVTVNPLPVTSSISGNATPACNAVGEIYSVELTAGSTYSWTVPEGSVITSGATGPDNNQITVDFGSTNGNITVIETNTNSCSGEEKILEISLAGCDLAANFEGFPLEICEGETVTFTDISTGTTINTSYNWNFGEEASPSVANTKGPHDVVYSTAGLKTISLTITDGASDEITKTDYISVNPTIGETVFTEGDINLCQGAADEKYTATAENSTAIEYSVSPAEAGAIDAVSGTMSWDPDFSGIATITATATGPCGTSSANLDVTVNPKPSVSITGSSIIAVGGKTYLSPVSGGTWTSSNPDIASVSNDSVVTGLSAGTVTFIYTDDLTGCSNETEPITVKLLPAGWEINPPDYTYNGQVTAKVIIDGSEMENGVLAAFAVDECRGITNASYFPPDDHYVYELICYDNSASGSRLNFKFYDPVTDLIYDMDRTVDFVSDMVIGNATSPLIMSVGIDFYRSFPVGWSWFSMNIMMDDMTLGNVLSCSTSGDYIKNQVAAAEYYSGYGWFGELSEIDPTELYKLKIQNSCDINKKGWAVDVASTPINLVSGWNWIGYLPQVAIPINEALSSVTFTTDDYIKNQTASSTYYEGFGWFGEQLPNLLPSDGYMMKVANAGTIIYPTSSGKKSSSLISTGEENTFFNPYDYEFNGSLTAKILVNGIIKGSENDKLIAYVKDEIRGVASGQYFEPTAEYLYPIMIHSNLNEGEIVNFRYYDASADSTYTCNETLVFKSDMIIADAFNSFELNAVIENNDLSELLDENYVKAYPNPFEQYLTIEYKVHDQTHVNLSIFDIFGRPIQILVDQEQQPGTYVIKWDALSQYNGMYIIKYKAGDVQKIQKVQLIR